MNVKQKITSPWWFTDKILIRFLKHGVPYLKGKLLDAGCGRMPYKELFECDEYIGLDVSGSLNPDIIGDLKNLNMFSDESFDSVLSNQVLEHIDDTDKVISELFRILKQGGHLCLTVPFISRLHGVPNDYWRFSRYGLEYLLKKHKFEVVFIKPMGGFLTTQCFLWQFFIYEICRKTVVTRVLFKSFLILINPILLSIHYLDKDTKTSFNYIAVARKM